jgi:hypothetical protein
MLIKEFILKNTTRANRPLISGKIRDLSSLVLPKNVILHISPKGPGTPSLKTNHILLVNTSVPLLAYFEQEGETTYGSSRRVPFKANAFIRSFRIENTGVRVVNDYRKATLREEVILGVDYTIISRNVAYGSSVVSKVWAWQNTAATIIRNLNTARDNYNIVHLSMPKYIPERILLKRNLNDIVRKDISDLADSSVMWVLEIYRFLAGEESLINGIESDDVLFAFSQGTKVMFISTGALREFVEKDSQADKHFYELIQRLQEGVLIEHEDTNVVDEEDEEDDTEESEDDLSDAAKIEKVKVERKEKKIEEEEEVETKDAPTVMAPRVKSKINEMIKVGKMNTGQARRIESIARATKDIKNPFKEGKSIGEIDVTKNITETVSGKIPTAVNSKSVPAGASDSITTNLIRQYVAENYTDDIIGMFTGLESGGIFVKDIKTTRVTDAVNDKHVMGITLVPVNGKEVTFSVDMPVIYEDGSFLLKGVRNTMDSQRTDVPVRKVNENKASITSYAGKMFVTRSDLSKYSYESWLINKITKVINDPDDERVSDVTYGSTAPVNVNLPLAYSTLMRTFVKLTVQGKHKFVFEYSNISKNFGSEELAYAEKNGLTPCGTSGKETLYMDSSNSIFIGDKYLGLIEDVIGDFGKKPSQIAQVGIRGRQVPVCIVLGYLYGLDKLLEVTGVKHSIVPRRELREPLDNEILISFSDDLLYIEPKDFSETILWNGLAVNNKFSKLSEIADYDKKNIWKVLAGENYQCTPTHFLEWELMDDLFYDPISKEYLRDEMKLPTDIKLILLHAVDLLKDNATPRESDPMYLRQRGLERIPGMLYLSMYNRIREQRRSPSPGNTPVSIPQWEIIDRLGKDATVQLAKRLNPIDQLKETEAVSLAGEGGRTARTLVKRHRSFDTGDLGLVSEGTPDSAKVGIRAFVPPNVKIKSIRGTYGKFDPLTDNATSLLSTSSNALADADKDDGKRSSLAGAQASHVVPVVGGVLPPYYSSYSSVIASRVSDFFVFVAKKDGVVTKVGKEFIQVTYDDGVEAGYKLGIKYGKSADTVVPHKTITDVSEGHKFKSGDLLAWNDYFFVRDFYAANNLVMKNSVQATVAFMEGNGVLEDGSLIAANSPILKGLVAPTSKEKGIKVSFKQEIFSMTEIGTKVVYDTPLLTISDTLTGAGVSDETLKALQYRGNVSPSAHKEGVVGNIDVYYMGNIDDMSDSLKELVTKYEKIRLKRYKDTRSIGPGKTGKVIESTFIGGERMEPNNVIIVFNIDSELDFVPGDKMVLCNQLKTIPGGIMPGITQSKSGIPIDLVFGWRSVLARIVASVFVQGTKNRVVRHRFNQLADEYLAD